MMDSLIEQYESLINERERLAETKQTLEYDENTKKYIMLRKIDRRLLKEQHSIYEIMQNETYDKCNHILVYTKINEDVRGRVYKKCGCIKCGLDENIINNDNLTFEEKVMENYLKKHNNYINGKDLKIECDLSLGMAIYSKLKEKYPDIDDSKAIRYFKYAIKHIKFVEVSEKRKQNRAKRLLLSPTFDNWKSPNDIWKKND